jgi:hypothetical protein
MSASLPENFLRCAGSAARLLCAQVRAASPSATALHCRLLLLLLLLLLLQMLVIEGCVCNALDHRRCTR